jgi:serine/threonine-protein kinase
MPPEQARGDGRAVDRRSDIYSLGATLYELWTGRVPLPATTPYEAVERAIHDDPPALRSLVPSLPIDLETIALKCLAKDPAQRYPSARALADDLGRYLAGDPILGRREPLWQRLARRARRNRALVTLGAGSLVAILVVAGLGIRTWRLSAERARLAERLSHDASDIENSLKFAYLSPLHDIRRDRSGIRDRMHRIQELHPDLGELGDAIVHQALGRGHLALHEWREAADELARAAAGGLETPELHAARGRALGELYRRALDELGRPSSDQDARAWLAQRDAELVREYLTPALGELELSRASGDDATLLEARIALYRRDFETAERRAAALTGGGAVAAEALRLAGDAAYLAAVQAFDHGDDAIARPALERAVARYKDASDIARSDASLYQAAAAAWLQIAEIDFRRNTSLRPALDRAIDLIENNALRADPEDAPSYVTQSAALLRSYRTWSKGDEAGRRLLVARTVNAAARAVEIDRTDAQSWIALGTAYIYRGIYEFFHGGKGSSWWGLAREAFERALQIRPSDPRANNDLGLVHRWLGAELDKGDEDPMPQYKAAEEAYVRAGQIDPQYLYACINLAELHTLRAENDVPNKRNPKDDVASAERVGSLCSTKDGVYFSVLDAQARAEIALAQYQVAGGEAPTDALRKARDYLTRSEEAFPGHPEASFQRLAAERMEAIFRLRERTDPTIAVAAGREALRAGQKVMSDSARSFVDAARLDLIEAAWKAHAETSSTYIASLLQAKHDAFAAASLDANLPNAQILAAKACLELAIAQHSPIGAGDCRPYAEPAQDLDSLLPRGASMIDRVLQRMVPPM